MRALALLSLTLSGCTLLEPVVAVGIVSRVEPGRDLPAAAALPDDLALGVGASLFLADATEGRDPDVNGIAGAELALQGCDEAVPLLDQGDGRYVVAGALPACTDRTVVAVRSDEAARVAVTLPDAPVLDVPLTWTAGSNLFVDLDGLGWDAALVDLVDGVEGEVVWTDRPDRDEDWRRLLTGGEPPGTVVVPDDVLVAGGRYVLAVTGLRTTPGSELDDVNRTFSAVAGGHTSLWPLAVTR